MVWVRYSVNRNCRRSWRIRRLKWCPSRCRSVPCEVRPFCLQVRTALHKACAVLSFLLFPFDYIISIPELQRQFEKFCPVFWRSRRKKPFQIGNVVQVLPHLLTNCENWNIIISNCRSCILPTAQFNMRYWDRQDRSTGG